MILPIHITDNIKNDFPIRTYQAEAIDQFIKLFHNRKANNFHGLFHMATGSGKTLIMAASMLHLYKLGYRNFMFFVSSKSILEKTKYNFLRSDNPKYLFNQNIFIDGKKIEIKTIQNLDQTSEDNINIIFTTIQKLHYSLISPSENEVTIDDFKNKNIVLISDEAHHINTSTKQLDKNKPSWENTVENIVGVAKQSLLLEFTATMPLSHPSVSKKYQDKIIYNYPLHKFRDSGYSKLVKTNFSRKDEMMRLTETLVASQYRKYIFEKHNIHISPIVLVKSNTIATSANHRIAAIDHIAKLTSNIIADAIAQSNLTFVKNIANYYSLEQLCHDIKKDFSDQHILSVDSANDSEHHQILLNNLESPSNRIRLIFVVDKLNEGWDVLNLFDIIKLGGSTGKAISKKSTTAEAQLIGRGARYFPFKIDKDQNRFTRKFDNSNHPLSICEQLYFHAPYIPEYIDKMEQSLIDLELICKEKLYFTPEKSNSTKPFQLKHQVFGKGNIPTNSTSIPSIYFKKAMNKLPFYSFDNLKKVLPEIHSANTLYLSEYEILLSDTLDNLEPEMILSQVTDALKSIQQKIQS